YNPSSMPLIESSPCVGALRLRGGLFLGSLGSGSVPGGFEPRSSGGSGLFVGPGSRLGSRVGSLPGSGYLGSSRRVRLMISTGEGRPRIPPRGTAGAFTALGSSLGKVGAVVPGEVLITAVVGNVSSAAARAIFSVAARVSKRIG